MKAVSIGSPNAWASESDSPPLFRQHLGASPVSVAQTRRVLLAKQLIHETRLPMADVALASGFGSIRRFNEIFQRLFDRPPCSAARHRRRIVQTERRSHHPSRLSAPTTGPRWSRSSRLAPSRASRWSRTIDMRARSRSTGCTALSRWPASGHALRVAIRFSRLSALPTIIARVRRVFDLAADPQAVNAQLAEDPILAPLVAARPGLRVPGAWMGSSSPFGPCSVSNHGGRRSRPCGEARDALRRGAGRQRPEHGGADHVFPRPEHVASAT